MNQNIGAIIGVIIIIILIISGGWYFWDQFEQQKTMRESNSELQATSTDGIGIELEADLKTIENDDLGESDIESVDNEFKQ